MSETRKIAAILVADVVGYSRLAGADEIRTLSRLRGLRSDLIDPAIAANQGRVVKRTGDGALVEFRSVVDAVRCAIEVQDGMVERNAGLPHDRRIDFRIGVHLGDIVEESDGDLMGDGVNIAARLESIAQPGGIVVSATAYEHVRDKLRHEFIDMGERVLKNIARPVHVYRVVTEAGAGNSNPTGSEKSEPALALPDKPSVAVLPFHNMSDDASQEYFADGMVEDIITGLSRIKWLFVIARNSSFVYKQKAVDVRQVGRELGVRYVVEGSVRKVGNRLRVTAQLVEAETGSHLWADKYDGPLEDVFEFQDRITERLVGIVEPSVRKSEIERSRRKRPENLDAYDLFLRAMPHLQARMPDQARMAIPLLQKALKLDPDYPAAHAHLAWCHEWCFTRGGLDEADRNVALLHARTAIASDTDDAAALAVAGWVVIVLSKERELAIAAIERALALNPSCATAHYFAALVNSFSHQPAATAFHARQALRLSPFDPSAFEAHLALGMSAVGESKFEEAVSHFAKATQINPRHSLFPFMHAIALALAGRAEETTGLIRRGLELEPGFRIRIFSEFGMARSLSDKFIEGARLLGLPE
jgi:TolB-like protein/class 3 adenylate cyclase/tetratricopeptide (TPR) repeat protein